MCRMVAYARNLPFWIRNPVKSRFYFYNTGRYLTGSREYDTKSFVGSHGEGGCVPWPAPNGIAHTYLNQVTKTRRRRVVLH